MKKNMPPGRRFSIIDRAFKYRMDEETEHFGLTPVQMRILGEISRLEDIGVEEINQRDLERAEQVTHPTMTATIQRLEKKGFVNCTTSTVDRRYKKISCTEKSAKLHEKLAALDKKIMGEICKGVTEEEIQMLLDITDKILINIGYGLED